MKIAIISSVYEQTPPLRYGGIERVLDFLVKGLKTKGHDVTFFLPGNSQKRSEENAQQAKIAAHYEIPVITNLGTEEYSVIIDALLWNRIET